jgi:preprotein translocase subunit SecA
VLEGADLHEQIRGMVDETIEAYVGGATEGFPEEWDLPKLWTALKTLYPVGVTEHQLEEEAGGIEGLTRDLLLEELRTDAHRAYDAREEALGAEVMRELERRVLLSVLDRKWREHLYEMDYLREGIGLRAYSQRDPLVEYQREGFELFSAMMDSIKEESVGFLFNVEVQVAEPAPDPALEAEAAQIQDEAAALVAGQPTTPAVAGNGAAAPAQATTSAASAPAVTAPTASAEEPNAPVAAATRTETQSASGAPSDDAVAPDDRPQIVAKGLSQPQKPKKLAYTAPTVDGDARPELQVEDTGDQFGKVARNELCPCGSGRKFKRCHGDPARRNA